ncbi:MAG: hypothetical protein Q8J89_15295 [Caulobacter sp.]|nr:hypothetical protein [Caulobacter sp.]
MSSDLTDRLKIDDPAARELPAMRAAWPAWTLAILALLTFFLQIARGSPDDLDGLRGLTLSAASLEQGQWWTLATHAVVQAGAFGHIAAIALFVGMGLSTLAARDKDWMGGWRMLAVFVLTSAAAALVHFLSGRTEPLTGMWQGVAGLAGFYLASGRWPRPVASWDSETGKGGQWERARGLVWNWVALCLTAGNMLDDHPFVRDNPLALAISLGVVGVVALVVGRWGSSAAVKLVAGLMLCAWMLVGSLFLVAMVQAAQPNFWIAPFSAVMTGVVLGVIERGWSTRDDD